MTLVLDYWETLSLTAGCNLYSKNFQFCVLTVKSAELGTYSPNSTVSPLSHTMYYKERDKPVVNAETFLSTAVPRMLIGMLIVFLNVLAISAMTRSKRLISSKGGRRSFYVLPQSTQGLLNSLFTAYLLLGLLTIYSQISLSLFILSDYRIFSEQGKECLVVNCVLIGLSIAISLHLVSLAVDRTLSSYLSFAKYSALSRGTVPLWLLAIWLPSLLIGSLPLAGWKTSFSFCIFLYQFNDDYLRFVAGFHLTCIAVMPCLYLFFVTVLRPVKTEIGTLYRWHRKLQAHHKLTFILVLVVNVLCWTPFYIYLLLACLSCPWSSWANAYILEYLSILSSIPSVVIPLMFTMRSSSVRDRCAKFVHFREDENYEDDFVDNRWTKNLRYQEPNGRRIEKDSFQPRSSLFFIDSGVPINGSNKSSRRNNNFFVPRYFPNTGDVSKTKTTVERMKSNEKNKKWTMDAGGYNNSVTKFNAYRELNGRAPLKNFCAYFNSAYEKYNECNAHYYQHHEGRRNKKFDVVEDSDSDSKCGFPISGIHPPASLSRHQKKPSIV